MARIFIRGVAYEEIDFDIATEKHYEEIILSHSKKIFETYFVLNFKIGFKDIKGEIHKPDLLLINKNYEQWIICEVETNKHPDIHVENQIGGIYDSIKNGIFDKNKIYSHAKKKLDNKSIKYNGEKLKKLINDVAPEILVVVNDYVPRWKEKLKIYDTQICVLQVLKDKNTNYSLRINGDFPIYFNDFSTCYFKDGFIVVKNPHILEQQTSKIQLLFDNKVSFWKIKKNNKLIYLDPISGHSIPAGKELKIFKLQSNENKYMIGLH